MIQYELPDLSNLIGLRITAATLQIQDVVQVIPGEDVMAAVDSLVEPQAPDQDKQIVETDIGV